MLSSANRKIYAQGHPIRQYERNLSENESFVQRAAPSTRQHVPGKKKKMQTKCISEPLGEKVSGSSVRYTGSLRRRRKRRGKHHHLVLLRGHPHLRHVAHAAEQDGVQG
jgi:hypothetical protein